jgi:hypothetical protein
MRQAPASYLPDEVYRFLGQSVAVRANSADILSYINSVYRWFRAPPRVAATTVLEVEDRVALARELVIRDGRSSLVLRCRSLHALNGMAPDEGDTYPLAYVEGALLRCVARLATGHDVLHAAAVAARGRAVVLAGPSGRGKTTLCLALLQHGFGLLSDELACVRRVGTVVDPFPRLIKFDEQSRRVLGIAHSRVTRARYIDHGAEMWLMEVEEAAPEGVSAPAPLGAVILLDGFAAETRLEPAPPVASLLALSRLSLRRPPDPGAAVFGAAPFVGAVPCYTLTVGDLDAAVSAVGTLVAAGAGVG